jgi:hypothetical protein
MEKKDVSKQQHEEGNIKESAEEIEIIEIAEAILKKYKDAFEELGK